VEGKVSHFFNNIDFEETIGHSIYHYLKKYSDGELIRKIYEFEVMENKKPFMNFEEYAEIANFYDQKNTRDLDVSIDEEIEEELDLSLNELSGINEIEEIMAGEI
jgi:heme oxygenase